MNRRAWIPWLLSAASAFAFVPACSSPDKGEGYADVDGVEVPTENEAQRQADTKITEANADTEFEELMKEIDEDAAKPYN